MSFHSEFAHSNLFDRFTTLIARRTGLVVKSNDRHKIAKELLQRAKQLKLNSPENYYQHLVSQTSRSNREWQQLIGILTNNESYFFRDRSQIELLKNIILPELISRSQKYRTLRICSAGCSTGEEPYTIAIILKELIPDYRQWNLSILGIDIDRQALQKARLGIYSEWSFRGVEPQIRRKYFQLVDNGFQLTADIKRMVSFSRLNLVEDDFLSPKYNLRNIDLLICRNVFIYFSDEAIARVLNKFYYSLQPLGYLVTGHTEIAHRDLSKFRIQIYKESIVYQRPQTETAARSLNIINCADPQLESMLSVGDGIDSFQVRSLDATSKPDSKPASVLPEKTINSQTTLQAAKNSIPQQQYDRASTELKKIVSNEPNNAEAYSSLAQTEANFHNYEKATEYCQKALDIDSLAVFPHYLLAQIAEEKGNVATAKQLLKKIIYLDPNFVNAYLDLSQIYQTEGDRVRARKMQQAALGILKTLPPKSKIEHRNEVTVSEAIAFCQQHLGKS